MLHSLLPAFIATAFTGLSLCLWRLAYPYSDGALLGLVPLALVVLVGAWPVNLLPWKARLQLALRDESPLARILTGRLRAALLSTVFTLVALSLLAWQSLEASPYDFMILAAVFLLAGSLCTLLERRLISHLHHPFARSVSNWLATWVVAIPAMILFAAYIWGASRQPGAMLDASLQEALQIGLAKLPERGGWIASILAIPYGYEAAKLWAVVQLREYPIAGVLFSLDTALFVFVLCRTAVIVTLFVQENVLND